MVFFLIHEIIIKIVPVFGAVEQLFFLPPYLCSEKKKGALTSTLFN